MVRPAPFGAAAGARRGRAQVGLVPRALIVVLALALLALGLGRDTLVTEALATLALAFGLLALAGALHALSVRGTNRYALDGAAWVTTTVAVVLALVTATVPGT